MKIKKLLKEDLKDALDLAIEVFREFVAIDYSQEGINEFYRFLNYQDILKAFQEGKVEFWGCYDQDLLGIIATKDKYHISLLFVRKDYHRCGIGRNLIQEVIKEAIKYNYKKITVNSSPYAINFYRHLGFLETDKEQIVNGIRFTPMEYIINSD